MLAFISSRITRDRAGLRVTFARAALAYWIGVFPRACAHIARWQRRAGRIPDPELRRLARAALREKRTNIEGACAFAACAPRALRGRVTLALGSFQAAYNLLDMLGEQPSPDPVADGRRLHEALLHALDPDAPAPADPGHWYEHHPRREDGGYLQQLLDECRGALRELPAYMSVASLAQEAAARIVAFQSLNLSESQGDHAALEQWARAATPAAASELQWWEIAAAAGSSLSIYALIAATANPDLEMRDAHALDRAYFPWIGGLHSLLDNLIDKREDEAAGHRSLVEYYGPQRAAERMRWLTERATAGARELPAANIHQVVLAGMIGSYLSAPQARSGELEPVASAVIEVAGPLMRPVLLVFKLRRVDFTPRGASAKLRRIVPKPRRLDKFG